MTVSALQIAKWHRNWNIIDSYHDGKGITSNTLFKTCLRHLYGLDKKLSDYSSFQSILNYRESSLIRHNNYSTYFTTKGIGAGIQDNNPNPAEFGLTDKKTISQIFDPSTKNFAGFWNAFSKKVKKDIVINGNLANKCVFNYKRISAKSGASGYPNGFFFELNNFQTHLTDTYTNFADENGDIDSNISLIAHADKGHDYIGGNKTKNVFIQGASTSDKRECCGFVLAKLLGDLSHTWFCTNNDLICTSDTFLLKRCIIDKKSCLFSRFAGGTQQYNFYWHNSAKGAANFNVLFQNPHISTGGGGKDKKVTRGTIEGHEDSEETYDLDNPQVPSGVVLEDIQGIDGLERGSTPRDISIDHRVRGVYDINISNDLAVIDDVYSNKDFSCIRASRQLKNLFGPSIVNNIINNIIKIHNKIKFITSSTTYNKFEEYAKSVNQAVNKLSAEDKNKELLTITTIRSRRSSVRVDENPDLQQYPTLNLSSRPSTVMASADFAAEQRVLRHIQIIMFDEIAKLSSILTHTNGVYTDVNNIDTDITCYDIMHTGVEYNQIVYDEYNIIDIFQGDSAVEDSDVGDSAVGDSAVEHDPGFVGKSVKGGGGNDNNLIYIVEIIVIAIISLLQNNISSEDMLKQDKWELIYDEKKIYKTTSFLENVDDRIYFLFLQYNSIIEKLNKFLINSTIRINEKDYHSENIIEYIKNYIKQFEIAIHNPQTKEKIKKKLYSLKNNYTLFNEELFKWVPSNLFFYSKDMNTSIYQIEEEYYTPLQIPKIFKYLDDGLVFEIFGIENTFLGHETFYELVIHELKINEQIESSIKLQRNYGFKLLLYFLEIKYSLIMPMNDDDDYDTLITNYKNTNYLKNIRYFIKNGVSIENSIYFSDLLCDVSKRNILNCDDLVFEILREFGGNDLYVSYSFYNEYLPYFFVDVSYIYSIDLFYNIIQVFNNPVDSISIYKQIEYVRYEHKNKTLTHSLKCLCDEPGIKKIKNVDMLISFCVKNKNNIDDSYLTTFINSLKLLPYKFIQENLTEIDKITEMILKNVDSHKKTHISKKTMKHKLRNLSKKIEMIRKHSKTQTTRYINPTKRRINSKTKRRINSKTKRRINSKTKRRINSRTQKHLPNLPIIYGHG